MRSGPTVVIMSVKHALRSSTSFIPLTLLSDVSRLRLLLVHTTGPTSALRPYACQRSENLEGTMPCVAAHSILGPVMRRAISLIIPPTLLTILVLLAGCGWITGPTPTLVPFPTSNITPSPIIIRVTARIPTRTPTPTATIPAGVALSAQAITPDNVAQLQTLRSAQISRSAILAVAFAPRGRRVATFGYDKMVRVFDADSLDLIYELPGHGEYGYGLGWSPDGRRLASAGRFDARVWDMATGNLLSSTPIQTWGERLAWHHSGERFAVVGKEYSRIEIIGADGGKLDDVAISGFVLRSVAYSANGLLLATGDQARNIHILNGESLTHIFTLQASSVPLDVEFSPNDQLQIGRASC